MIKGYDLVNWSAYFAWPILKVTFVPFKPTSNESKSNTHCGNQSAHWNCDVVAHY